MNIVSIVAPKAAWSAIVVDGPIVGLKRSPFFKDVLLVAGGWMFQIWREKIHVNILLLVLRELTSSKSWCYLIDESLIDYDRWEIFYSNEEKKERQLSFQSGSLLHTAPLKEKITDVEWSPTRPGVFFIAKQNGSIDIWDIIDRTHAPSISQSISSSAVTYLNIKNISCKFFRRSTISFDDVLLFVHFS